MKRREFIAALGGAVAWPLGALAQQPRSDAAIGLLSGADEASNRVALAAFLQALNQLGWIEGRNIRIEIVGVRATPTPFVSTRRSLRRSPRTSSWPLAPLQRRCCRQRARCRLCLCSFLTRSAPASSIAWRDLVAMPPGLCSSNTV